MNPQIHSLHIYPIKSCHAIDLQEMLVGNSGPLYDREWMLIDAATGAFQSQRQFPLLALVIPTLTDSNLKIQIPGFGHYQVPLHNPQGTSHEAIIWGANCEVIEEDEAISKAFSTYVSHEVRFVRMHPNAKRHLKEKYGHPDKLVKLSDQFPFLITTLKSLEQLNAQLTEPVPMTRFRANIVLTSAQPFEEDGWKNFRLGNLEFETMKSCLRCVIIDIDQDSGVKKAGPLKALAGLRKDPATRVTFGQLAISLNEGCLRVGDTLKF